MAKITLADISTAGVDWTTLINTVNANNALVEAAIENTVSRNGLAPNAMSDVLDMNDNMIINHPWPIDNTDAVNKIYVDTKISELVISGGGVLDHGLLTGLEDDDHPQYTSRLNDEVISGSWRYEYDIQVAPGISPSWWQGFYVEVQDSLNYTWVWAMAEGAGSQAGFSPVLFSDVLSAMPEVRLCKGRGESGDEDLSGALAVGVGDYLGFVSFAGFVERDDPLDNDFVAQALIESVVTGDKTTTDGQFYETDLRFTVTNGSARRRVMHLNHDGVVTYDSSQVVATGGPQGAGTINAKGFYIDGVAVGTGGGGVTDHGALTGLSDDDHTQYLKKAGDTMTGLLTLASNGVDIASTDTTLTRLAAGKPGVEGKALIKHTGAYTSGEVTFSTSAPSGGNSGDIWFQYTA